MISERPRQAYDRSEDLTPVENKDTGRVVHVLPETLKEHPERFKKIPPSKLDSDGNPSHPGHPGQPRLPKKPAKPARPEIPRNPPPSPIHPPLPPLAPKPAKRPRPVKNVPLPKTPRPSPPLDYTRVQKYLRPTASLDLLSRGLDMTLAQRVVARFKAAGRNQYRMMTLDGADRFWPIVEGFALSPERSDVFGDVYEASYQCVQGMGGGEYHPGLFVDFYANAFVNREGRRPGKFEVKCNGKGYTGTFTRIEEIPAILARSVQFAESVEQDIKAAVERLGGPNWELHYDNFELSAEYRQTDPMRDSGMSVTFDNPGAVLFGNKRETARIWYTAGADYEGHYGEHEVEKTYGSTQDIQNILSQAERLFQKWDNQPS